VAVIVLGAVAWMFVGDRTPSDDGPRADHSTARAKARSGDDRRRDASLEDRVAALEDELGALRLEVRRLGGRPVVAASRPSSLDAPTPEEPAFEQAVRSVVEAERAREEEARVERRRDQWQGRLEELSTELTERAGLRSDQSDQVVALWSAEAEELLPLIMAARSGEGSFREVREQAEAIRARTDEQIAQLLDARQLEIYGELRPRGPGREGRGGRGREPER
jgi:hypothetical protein